MPKEVFSMVISVCDDGSVNLTGPLDNQILCLGLLEAAKKKVNDHNDKKERPAPDLSIKTLTHEKKDQPATATGTKPLTYNKNAFGHPLAAEGPMPPVKDAKP